jgi:acyl carrier protein
MMDRADIIKRLEPVMQDVFDDDSIQYRDDLSANDVEEWDSLSHIRFIVAVEKTFRVRFTSSEMEGFNSVGDLVDAVAKKTA